MRTFLAQEIATAKRIAPNAVNLHIIPWSDPLVLRDNKPCNSCQQTRNAIWTLCNKEQFKISSATPLVIVDYEEIVADFYKKSKPKHCDFVIEGVSANGNKRIALCDLTCQKEEFVNNPAPSKKYPTGKREYAWTQMGETIKRWKAKATYGAMIGQYTERLFIFGWRDSDVPQTMHDEANRSMTDFSLSTTSTVVGPLSFGKRDDFELIQVKYPTIYNW